MKFPSESLNDAVRTDMVKIHNLYFCFFWGSSVHSQPPALPVRFGETNKLLTSHYVLENRPFGLACSASVSHAVLWLRRLVAGLTFRRPGFNPRLRRCGDCGVQSGTGTGSPDITSAVSCQYHSTSALYSFIHLLSTVYKLNNWQRHHVRHLKKYYL